MKWTLGGLAAVFLSASCVVQVGSDNGGGASQPKRPQAARKAPAPRPAPPPPTPAAMTPRPAAVTPTPAPAVAAPAPTQANAVNPGRFMGATLSTVNLVKIQQIASRNPKNCGYVEVSDNNWVHVDCTKYTAATKVVAHLSPRKLRLVKARKTSVKPIRFQSAVLKLPAGRGGLAVGGNKDTGGPGQVGETYPNSVDHRETSLEGPIKNQGVVGSCTAHSLSTALDNAAIRAGNLKPGDKIGMTSPMHVWSRYGLPNMGAAADSNIAQPIGVYTTWQQSDAEACMMFQGNGSYATECAEVLGVKPNGWREDKALMAKYNKSQSEGLYKISSIEKLETEPPNMDELLSVLASGADVWAAFAIDGASWSNKKMKDAVMPDWKNAASGHAVVVSGYRQTPSGRQFLIHNSWGESWGEKGYAWLSEKMLVENMYYAYKVKITNGVKKEDLTDDDCAPDELVDLGTGLCAILCSDDSRPNNGCKK